MYFYIHKPEPLVTGFLDQDQVACHIPLSSLSVTRSSPLQARALLCKQVLQTPPKRFFFLKPQTKTFHSEQASFTFFEVLLNRRPCNAHKTLEHLANGVNFTCSPAQGTWLLFPLAWVMDAGGSPGSLPFLIFMQQFQANRSASTFYWPSNSQQPQSPEPRGKQGIGEGVISPRHHSCCDRHARHAGRGVQTRCRGWLVDWLSFGTFQYHENLWF